MINNTKSIVITDFKSNETCNSIKNIDTGDQLPRDGHQYQHKEQSPLILTELTEHKNTTTYDDENPVPGFGQLQQWQDERVHNDFLNIQSLLPLVKNRIG
jgi:hypothetical protein